MHSSCLANHVTPATPVTETKNCLYISHHTPLFGALDWFRCVGWSLSPSVLEIKFPSCLCITVVDLFILSVGSEIRAQCITFGSSSRISGLPGRTTLLVEGNNLIRSWELWAPVLAVQRPRLSPGPSIVLGRHLGVKWRGKSSIRPGPR